MRLHITITTAFVSVIAASADAEPTSAKRLGIGIGVGVTTGPNLQVLTSGTTHLDVGVGMQWDEHMRVQADHAWRLVDLSTARTIGLPVYLGIGGFLSDHRSADFASGIRMPLGLQADFAHAPVQVFGEVAPELALVRVVDRYMEPPPELALTGLIGVRATL